MKKVLICVVGMLVLATAAWSQSTEKAVAALENQWLQSQKSNNVDLLIPLLAEKFINTSSDGKVTGKSETVAEYKKTVDDRREHRREGHSCMATPPSRPACITALAPTPASRSRSMSAGPTPGSKCRVANGNAWPAQARKRR